MDRHAAKHSRARRRRKRRLRGRRAVVAALALALASCGSDEDAARPPAPVAILSAFPAELAPLVAAARVREQVSINGRVFRVGEIGGVPVVLALTGIGLINARNTTRDLLDHFAVRGIVFSGVAGSSLRIGDVTTARTWSLADGSRYSADEEWLALAEELARERNIVMETCTVRPLAPGEPVVCLAHVPALLVGGSGSSTDSFGNAPQRCQPSGGEVFGCDVDEAAPVTLIAGQSAGLLASIDAETITTADMESAAVAREAAARAVRFIAFRGTSDGSGDPLDLPGFPAQFFTYYRLAAHNAAAAAIGFLAKL